MDREKEYYLSHQFHDRDGSIPEGQAYAGQKKARKQDEIILEVFRMMPHLSFSAEEIEPRTGFLMTSIRRSLTGLCKTGKIEETGEKRGKYGVNIKTYTLAKPKPQQTTLFQ